MAGEAFRSRPGGKFRPSCGNRYQGSLLPRPVNVAFLMPCLDAPAVAKPASGLCSALRGGNPYRAPASARSAESLAPRRFRWSRSFVNRASVKPPLSRLADRTIGGFARCVRQGGCHDADHPRPRSDPY